MGNPRTCFAPAIGLAAALLLPGCTPRPAATLAASLPSRCLVSDTTAESPDTVYAIAVTATGRPSADCEGRPFATTNAPVVVAITVPPGADLRDVLEGRAPPTRRPDVIVTRDPPLIDFARRRGGYLVAPLTWSISYVLATAGTDDGVVPDEAQRAAIARDAVSGDARGALEPFPWLTDSACTKSLGVRRSSPAPVIIYSSGDAIARGIAERVVSLAASRGNPTWLPEGVTRGGAALRVAPLAPDSIVAALASGRAAAGVLALARDPLAPCGLSSGAPVPRGAIPLVDSRSHAIVRQGSGVTFIVGLDGTLHIVKRVTR
jgi:hypothetical protein